MTGEPDSFLTETELPRFLDDHGDRIYTYLRVLCRDEERASDTLQNAYVKFLEQVRRGRVRRDSAQQYLQTIAKHDYFNLVKKERREEPLDDEHHDVEGKRRGSSEALARELRLVLMEAAADPAVPPEIADIIRLRFLEHAEVPAICERMGRSQATVYRLMEKALTVLADACRKAGIEIEDLSNE